MVWGLGKDSYIRKIIQDSEILLEKWIPHLQNSNSNPIVKNFYFFCFPCFESSKVNLLFWLINSKLEDIISVQVRSVFTVLGMKLN